MTIKQLLGMSVDELEKLTDAELLDYLRPSMEVVQNLKPASRSKNSVIDVSGLVERQAKKAESVEEFTKRMMGMAESLMKKQLE